jgi:hypothetical protein
MNIEQRLQHAARDLREVAVEVPPLGSVGHARPRSRVHALATPVLVPLLFVAGALLAIGATRQGGDTPVQSDLPAVGESVDPAASGAAVTPGDEPDEHDEHQAPAVDAPSALVEQQMIAEFISSARSAKPAPSPDDDPPSLPEPTDPPVNDIGAI